MGIRKVHLSGRNFLSLRSMTAWTGRTSPPARLPGASPQRSSRAPSSCSTTPPSTPQRPCPISFRHSFRRATPLSPSPRLSSRGSTPSTTPDGSVRPSPRPAEIPAPPPPESRRTQGGEGPHQGRYGPSSVRPPPGGRGIIFFRSSWSNFRPISILT